MPDVVTECNVNVVPIFDNPVIIIAGSVLRFGKIAFEKVYFIFLQVQVISFDLIGSICVINVLHIT